MLTVICGSMFSEKSTELQRRGNRLIRAGKRVKYYKPELDNRYSESEIVTHNGQSVPCENLPTNNPEHLLGMDLTEVDAILIDEVQFMSVYLPVYVKTLLKRNPNLSIIVAGLDMDYTGTPFATTAKLLAMAEEVVKLKAVCASCGEDSWVSARKTNDSNRVILGSDDIYHPLCRKCFNKKENEK